MESGDLGKPKHRVIFEYVQAAILNGEYEAGQQLPTDGQLMRKFKTSRPTVARAMRDLEVAGMLERRAGSGSFVKVSSQTPPRMIGLLIPELGETEVFEPICGEIARACQKQNLSLVWGDSSPVETDDHRERAEELCRRYISQGVAGVFFAPIEQDEGMDEVNRKVAEAFDRAGIAVVLLDRDLEPLPRRSRFDLVGIDNFRAGHNQAAHLLDHGCTNLHYLARPLSAPTVELRIAGFRHALHQQGMEANGDRVHRGDPEDPDFVAAILKCKPDGLVCANDITAAQLMQQLNKCGVDVPGQVKVMGLDDVKYAQLLSVPLTTLHQPCREIGAAAVQAMTQRLENRKMLPRDILLDVQLVPRASCGCH